MLGDAERRRGDRARSRSCGRSSAGSSRARRASPTTSTPSLILGMIGGVVATELFAQVFEIAPVRRAARRVHLDRPRGRSLRGPDQPASWRPASGSCGGPHGARRRVPRVPAVQQAPPHRHELLQHLLPQARAARRAAGDGPRGGGRDVRRCGRSPTSAGTTSSTASPAPSAAAASRPARPGTRASRSTRSTSSWASGTCRSRPSTASR